MQVLRRSMCFLAALAVAACNSDKLGPNISGVNAIGIVSVKVAPALDTIFVPDTVQPTDVVMLNAVAYTRTGEPLHLTFVWKSSNTSVATVDEDGLVHAVGPGTTTISASAGKVGTATIVVVPATESVVLSPVVDTVLANDPQIPARDTARFKAVARDQFGNALAGVSFSWQSSSGLIAAVDAAGLARAVAPGTATVTVSAHGHQATSSLLVLAATQSVTLSTALDTILVDNPIVPAQNTFAFTATAHDPFGGVLTRAVFAWTSSVTSVATVDPTGVVHAAGLGPTTITVTTGGKQATATVQVVPIVKSITVSSPVAQVLAGDTVQLSAQALNNSNAPIARSFVWTSSNPSIATVDSTGRVIFLTAGTATFTATSDFRSNQVSITASPRQLLAIDAGGDYTCGYTPLGRGYCWGLNSVGQLAPGAGLDSTCFNDDLSGTSLVTYTAPLTSATSPCRLPPQRMTRPELQFTSISAGGAFACGTASDGNLYCWGDGAAGQCGNGKTGCGSTPVLATVKRIGFTTVSAGGAHACGFNASGMVFCWGADSLGQLGDRRRINSTTPIPVFDTTLSFTAISAGGTHTCGIVVSGSAYCWGNDAQGQLGDGTHNTNDIPIVVAGGVLVFSHISAGGRHTCAIATTGAAYCWGDNNAGQLGIGIVGGDRTTPTLVAGGGTYSSISAGEEHTCAILTSGGARCWGNNADSQIGNGGIGGPPVIAPSNVLDPVTANPFLAMSITAGRRHTCAIGTDARTYCWGSNIFGALGNEYQAAYRPTPQVVATPR